MDEGWQQRVRERAYVIRQREGSPDGSAEQFWLMAEEELLSEERGPSSGPADGRPDRPRDDAQVERMCEKPYAVVSRSSMSLVAAMPISVSEACTLYS